MESSDGGRENASDETIAESPPTERRRLSMEEDYFYQEVVAFRQPPKPPSYDVSVRKKKSLLSSARKGKKPMSIKDDDVAGVVGLETLPIYTCDVHIEGVFQMKMEIENTIKRAEYRNWRTMYVILHGTALNIYTIKKDWGWGKTRQFGPNVSTDNPPWLRKASLERTYSLMYADVGIAADYHKRRYVIRLRAETDQFLLSCVELETFVKWLDYLFAAIDVAAPIDERDFPRDQSIPRIQRLRWLRGQLAAAPQMSRGGGQSFPRLAETVVPEPNLPPGDALPSPSLLALAPENPEMSFEDPGAVAVPAPLQPVQRRNDGPMARLSTTSYPNENIGASGKWEPRHRWTSTHDMIYAKLCYAVLLFKSPRKSNFVIVKGKRWTVDWATGNMTRVLPPSYDEPEFWGPWQHVHTENSRI